MDILNQQIINIIGNEKSPIDERKAHKKNKYGRKSRFPSRYDSYTNTISRAILVLNITSLVITHKIQRVPHSQ